MRLYLTEGRGVNLKSNITLRSIQQGDESLLFLIYASSRSEEMRITDWTDEQKRTFLEMQFTAQRQDYSQRFPDAEQSIILDNETPVGRLWVNRNEAEIRLLDIILLPEQQNTGTGTILLHQLQNEAGNTGKKLRHAVFKDNVNAIRFYQRLGFLIVEEHDMYYVMEWTNNIQKISINAQ